MSWLETIGKVAPLVATTLGGPLAGMAVKMATDALGIENSEKALESAVLSGSPEVLFQMKQVESNLKIELRKLGIKEQEIAAGDRSDARSLAKANMLPQIILSTIYTIGYCAVLWQFVTGDVVIPVESSGTFNIVLGVLTAAQTQIMNFWFGSSSGSKSKDKGL